MRATTAGPAHEYDANGWRRTPWVLAAAVVAAAGVVVLVGLLAGVWPYAALGSSDPGVVVRVGAPVLRLLADTAATVCVGSLVFALFFTDSSPSGQLCARGYAAVRSAGVWAGVWSAAALVLVPFDVANFGGGALLGDLPVATSSSPTGLFTVLAAMEQPLAWLLTAGLALLVAVGCLLSAAAYARALRWLWVAGVLGLALLALLPPLGTGHSASQTGHDLATAAIMIHVPVAVVWVGVLVALLRPRWRAPERTPALMRRYGRLALGAWIVLAASGVVDALVLVAPGAWVDTGYGLLTLAKIVLVGLVGLVGVRLRRGAATRTSGRGLAGLAAGELLVLAATMGLSVGLTHLPPPSLLRPVTNQEALLGYNLAGAPTVSRLLLDWRIDVLFAPLAALLAVGYLFGVWRLRRRDQARGGQGRGGESWPAGRTAAWLSGCVLLLVATSSGLGRYAAAMFSMHMTAHMIVAMLVPLALALGGPITLARRALSAAGPEQLPGPRDWLDGVITSGLVRGLTHPVVALGLFAGAPFALYFTGLFDAAIRYHWAHMLINATFLAIGGLFAWVTVGVDALPRPMPMLARLGVLLAAMPFGAVFAALVTNTTRVIGDGPGGGNMYSSLALPWLGGDLLGDQRAAGGIALALGELALLAAVAALLLRWNGSGSRLGTGPEDGSVADLSGELLRGRAPR